MNQNLKFTFGLVYQAFVIYLVIKYFPTASNGLVTLSFISTCWRIFCNHAGGHRYFAHKSFETYSWVVQLLAIGICTSSLGVVIYYWVFIHELHHAHCDTNKDMHSPIHIGFWHVQFTVLRSFEAVKEEIVRDGKAGEKLEKYYNANLSWLKNPILPVLIFIAEHTFYVLMAIYFFGSDPLELLLWAVLLPNVLNGHAIAATNSAAHTDQSLPLDVPKLFSQIVTLPTAGGLDC